MAARHGRPLPRRGTAAILIAAAAWLAAWSWARPPAVQPTLASPAPPEVVPAPEDSSTEPSPFRALEPGLEYAELPAPRPSPQGDSLIRVLRVDPRRFALKLLCASDPGQGESLTPRQWCEQNGLLAAANASMYAEDRLTAVSLLRTRQHVNNGHLTRHMAVLAFDALDDSVPPVQIIDRELQDYPAVARHYGALVQSIRMVALDGRNVWDPQPRAWSAAAVGIDRGGRVLLIHVQSPFTMHDLVEMLLELPLDLKNLMYTDGGPPSQLYVKAGGEEVEVAGAAELEDAPTLVVADPTPIPNVIGVARYVPWAPPSSFMPVH